MCGERSGLREGLFLMRSWGENASLLRGGSLDSGQEPARKQDRQKEEFGLRISHLKGPMQLL